MRDQMQKSTTPLLLVVIALCTAANCQVPSSSCDAPLKDGVFNFMKHSSSKSIDEATFEWLKTVTKTEFKRRQSAGFKVIIPVEGVGVPLGYQGDYTDDQIDNFFSLRDQGKMRMFSSQEWEDTLRKTASDAILKTWLDCKRLEAEASRGLGGLKGWPVSDDRQPNGTVEVSLRYFPNEPVPKAPVVEAGGLQVDRGRILGTNPLKKGDTVPFGGVSAVIQRDGNHPVKVWINTTNFCRK